MFASTLACCAALIGSPAASGPHLVARLTPQPQQLVVREGHYGLRGVSVSIGVPEGAEYEACGWVLSDALRIAGATAETRRADRKTGNRFTLGAGCDVPPLPAKGIAQEGYALAIGPKGAAAAAASPAGLLYASQTLRQLTRIFAEEGRLPALSIVDYPEFKVRGIYIEGGQERFGRIVAPDYLCEQIRRLAEFKMNTLEIGRAHV